MIAAEEIERIVEAALLAAGEPVSLDRLMGIFAKGELPAEDPRGALRDALAALEAKAQGRAFELARAAGGYRLQVRREYGERMARLVADRPARYSRALLETLALIAYRQPVTRGDIEDLRGVRASASIMHTLQERGWIRAVGHRETPGRPALYGTTRAFLDYFNLTSLDELPREAEVKALGQPLATDDAPADEGSPDEAAAAETPDAQDAPADDERPIAQVVQLPLAEPQGGQ